MLFDSHAHLNDDRFDEDREELIKSLKRKRCRISCKSRCRYRNINK